MAGPGFYKVAFWFLLTVVAVVQIVITVVAHQRHDDTHHSLLPDGRGPLQNHALNNNVPGKAKRSPSYHSDSKSTFGTTDPTTKKAWQEVLSSSPKIVLVHNFATKEECDHLIQLGIEKGMQRAQIIPYGGNQLIDSSTRTNTAAWLNYHQDPVVARIENSIASFTKTHPLDGESLQILHYGNGQPPTLLHTQENFEPGGNRIITGLVYLQNAEEGGETLFTKLDMRTKPDIGDLLLFWNTNSDGSICEEAEHAGTPPTKGQKWVATKWIHERLYQTKEAELRSMSPAQLSRERQSSVFS